MNSTLLSILGITITAIFGAFAVVSYYRTRRRLLKIIYHPPAVLNLRPDVIRGEAREKLSPPHFGETPLEVLSILLVTVRNSGGVEIPKSHVERPIAFQFPTTAEILHSEVVDRSPHDLVVEKLNLTDYRFDSLDADDFFTLQFLITGALGELPEISTRILGTTVSTERPEKIGQLPNLAERIRPFSGVVLATLGAALVTSALLGFNAFRLLGSPPLVSERPGSLEFARAISRDGFRLQVMTRALPQDSGIWIYTYFVRNASNHPTAIEWAIGGKPILSVRLLPPDERSGIEMVEPGPPAPLLSVLRFGPSLEFREEFPVFGPARGVR